MNGIKYPLFQSSLTIALLAGVLSRVLLRPGSPLADTSPGVQVLVAVLLLLLAVAGIALGVLSWKRKELKAGWSVLVIGLNAVEFLLVLLRLFAASEG